MNDVCACTEERKEDLTVKDVMGCNYDALIALTERLHVMVADLTGQEVKKIADQKPAGIIEALKGQNDLIRYCLDDVIELKKIMG